MSRFSPAPATGGTQSVTTTGYLLTYDTGFDAVKITVSAANVRVRSSQTVLTATSATTADQLVKNGDEMVIEYHLIGHVNAAIETAAGTATVDYVYGVMLKD